MLLKTVISGSILRLLGFSLVFQSQIPTSLTGDLFAGTSCKVKDLSSLLLETFSGVTIAGKGKVKLANLQQAWSPILLALGYTFAEFNAIFRTPHSRRTLLKDNGLLPADCEANTSPDLTAVTALAKSKTPTGAATGAAGQQDKQQTGTDGHCCGIEARLQVWAASTLEASATGRIGGKSVHNWMHA